jgi:hypothetical protein
MKKLILSIVLTVCAVVAAQADDAKPAKQSKDKETSACCVDKNAKLAKDNKSDKEACSGCCRETTQKVALLSPKAAAETRR